MKFIKDWFKSKTETTATQVEEPTESTTDFLSRYGETEPVDMVIKYIENNLDNFTISSKDWVGATELISITDGVIEIEAFSVYWDGKELPRGAVMTGSSRVVYGFSLTGLPLHLACDFSDEVTPSITKIVKIQNKRESVLRLKKRQEEQRNSIEYFTKLLGENK